MPSPGGSLGSTNTAPEVGRYRPSSGAVPSPSSADLRRMSDDELHHHLDTLVAIAKDAHQDYFGSSVHNQEAENALNAIRHERNRVLPEVARRLNDHMDRAAASLGAARRRFPGELPDTPAANRLMDSHFRHMNQALAMEKLHARAVDFNPIRREGPVRPARSPEVAERVERSLRTQVSNRANARNRR